MLPEMTLCPACRRHAFARESRCPFCAHALDATAPARVAASDPGPGASRAQRYAMSVALAAAAAACDHASPPPPAQEITPVVAADVPVAPPPVDAAVAPPTPVAAMDAAVADVAVDAAVAVVHHHAVHHAVVQHEFQRFRRFNNMPYGCVFPDASCAVVRA